MKLRNVYNRLNYNQTMVRERGEKGKHGETDRQIVFAILHNQIKDSRGLTKKQIAEIVEAATGKDRDGVRKRVAMMLGDRSPIKDIIKIENINSKIYHKLNPKNLKEACILYNFFEEEVNLIDLKEVKNFISPFIDSYIKEVIDFLHLWNPKDYPYTIPSDMLDRLSKEGTIDFYPKQFKETGPEKMKEIAEDFGIFRRLKWKLTDDYNLKKFCRLIENFERLVDDVRTEMVSEGDTANVVISTESFKDQTLKSDSYWFWSVWKELWEEQVQVNYINKIKATKKTLYDTYEKGITMLYPFKSIEEGLEFLRRTTNKYNIKPEEIEEEEFKVDNALIYVSRGFWIPSHLIPSSLNGSFFLLPLYVRFHPDGSYYTIGEISQKEKAGVNLKRETVAVNSDIWTWKED